PGSRLLTHCNTGGLATAGVGTALGVIALAHRQGKVTNVWVDETRPLLQGGRLTAWELGELGVPYQLIADSMAASLMAQVNAQMRPLFSKLPDGFHIGLNISVSHINAPTFIDDCLHYQRGFEGKAVKLMLEITEQEPLLLNGAVVDKLNTLHSRGFSIALDDFGTGYSGLSCLHELIFDYIKIDQSFVGRVTGEAPASKL
ncbi:EAL domain-containing protein, partial [Catenulispora yoronensis]|uniref:EAL domain-containing protein n=1 Tax=Catenulispora yoronensis TaxID=450799 RepID=UPI0031D32B63